MVTIKKGAWMENDPAWNQSVSTLMVSFTVITVTCSEDKYIQILLYNKSTASTA